LRIALNATCFNDRSSGAKQRFIGLYNALAERMPTTQFVIFEPHDCRMSSWFDRFQNLQTIRTTIPSSGRIRRSINASIYWAEVFRTQHFDIFESFHLPVPIPPGTKTIFTLHDVRHFQVGSNLLNRCLFQFALQRAISKSDVLVTVSNSMKRELLPLCCDTPIRVIYNGINSSSFMAKPTPREVSAFRVKYKLFSGFLLSVGHLETRKNYPRLLESVALLRSWGLNYPLLIVGNDSGELSHLESMIAALDLRSLVYIACGLSDLELRCAYHLSDLFVFPSLYEGFGIPILEAMASGCTMALSDIPVFREITQDQVAYFSPTDSTNIAQVIHRVLNSTSDQSRQRSYALNRVTQFSYSRLAGDYSKLYHDLLA